eukprot:m.155190 g.155190  ORF g.155190 m.155190 type:complete len:121 (-) comp17523_c0_seq7:1312-1674(-)
MATTNTTDSDSSIPSQTFITMKMFAGTTQCVKTCSAATNSSNKKTSRERVCVFNGDGCPQSQMLRASHHRRHHLQSLHRRHQNRRRQIRRHQSELGIVQSQFRNQCRSRRSPAEALAGCP